MAKLDRVWLYSRVSRDTTHEESIENQRAILHRFAEENNLLVKGESYDNDATGMNFEREGIAKLTEAVKKGRIDTVLVKDLSRLGRHSLKTDLYIEWLDKHDVRVYSVSEHIDTSNEEHELSHRLKILVWIGYT